MSSAQQHWNARAKVKEKSSPFNAKKPYHYCWIHEMKFEGTDLCPQCKREGRYETKDWGSTWLDNDLPLEVLADLWKEALP